MLKDSNPYLAFLLKLNYRVLIWKRLRVSVVFKMESMLTQMREIGDSPWGGKMIARCHLDRIREGI